MFENNILPIGEEGKHVPIEDCPCKPKVRTRKGMRYLMHYSMDHREIWLATENMLGITCYEHMLFIGPDYVKGEPHKHVPMPEPEYEYEHRKIDPR